MTTTGNHEHDERETNDLAPEYDFDYRAARPNRFAGKVDDSQVVVLLDPDIAAVFTTAESVNRVLRALIKTMPTTQASYERKRRSQSSGKTPFR